MINRRSFLGRSLAALTVAASLLVAPAFAAPNFSVAARNAALAAMTAKIDTGGAGTLVFYTGTQPATPDTALSGNTALVTLTFSATSFGTPSSGVATANAITSGTATTNGTTTFARAYAHDGTTAVIDFSVGTSGADINLATVSITTGLTVSVTSLTFAHP